MLKFSDQQLEAFKKLIDFEADSVKTFFNLAEDSQDKALMKDYAHQYNVLVDLREKVDNVFLINACGSKLEEATHKIYRKGITYH